MRVSFLFLVVFVSCAAHAADWPACTVRSGVVGGPAIVIDGHAYSPLMFMANNQFGRDEVLFKEVKMASEAGVNLIGFNVPLDWPSGSGIIPDLPGGNGTAEKAAGIIDQFCAANPKAYYYVRVSLFPSADWVKAHPDECVTKYLRRSGIPAASAGQSGIPAGQSGKDAASTLLMASPSSQLWRETTAKMLRERVEQIIHGPYGDRFLGVELEYLQTAEWFYPDTNDFMDYSPANLKAFRGWLRKQYGSERKLREAWNDANVTFDSAVFPTPDAREAADWGPFRDFTKRRPAIDMQRFQNELIADTISYFASVVKAATQRRSLVGAYYGYTMELNNNGPRALVQSGHLALGKLLECRDIDLLHAPLSYFERGIGQPGHLHAPVDSIVLHGKLPIYEEDFYTHLSQEPPKDLIAPGWNERTLSSQETCAVVARDFGTCFTHRAGMWLFDLLSDGRWHESTIWHTVTDLRRIAAALRTAPPFQPEVAFVVDENSPHFLKASTWPILIQSMSWWRSELDRIGTPVGYYLQSDLSRLPKSVKLVILADAFHLEPPDRRVINRFFSQGKTVLFNYAPGIATSEGVDMAQIKEVTGIDVQPKSDSVPMTIASGLSKEEIAIDSESWRPRFVVTSKDVDVVARYKATGEISAAAIPRGQGVSLYTATPRLPVGCLREICRRAGVHLYRVGSFGMTGVAGPYFIVHADTPGMVEFAWPEKFHSVERLYPPGPDAITILTENSWSDRLAAKTTAVYFVKK